MKNVASTMLVVGLASAFVSIVLLVRSGAGDHGSAFRAYLLASAIVIAGATIASAIEGKKGAP